MCEPRHPFAGSIPPKILFYPGFPPSPDLPPPGPHRSHRSTPDPPQALFAGGRAVGTRTTSSRTLPFFYHLFKRLSSRVVFLPLFLPKSPVHLNPCVLRQVVLVTTYREMSIFLVLDDGDFSPLTSVSVVTTTAFRHFSLGREPSALRMQDIPKLTRFPPFFSPLIGDAGDASPPSPPRVSRENRQSVRL